MRFYLGTHMPNWLELTAKPLCVSRRRLFQRKRFPKARGPWVLDSGAFTELKDYGGWTIGASQYAEEVQRFSSEIGRMEWAAVQDWMCESFMLGKTGKSIAEHQELTTQSYLDLRTIAPEIPWLPVLQGWAIEDYLLHVDQYRSAGIDLAELPVVGVGSVCRRQGTKEVTELFSALSYLGIRSHGFGLKTLGLPSCSLYLESADSLAWSRRARSAPPLRGCTHASCANCIRFALKWRRKVVRLARRRCQARLW